MSRVLVAYEYYKGMYNHGITIITFTIIITTISFTIYIMTENRGS